MEEAVKTFLTNVFKCYLDWIPQDVTYIYTQMDRVINSLYACDYIIFPEFCAAITDLQRWFYKEM